MATSASITLSKLSDRSRKNSTSDRDENSTPRTDPLSRKCTSTFFSPLESNTVAGSSGDPTASIESLASSPVISEQRYSEHENCQKYIQAYEQVFKECDDYYTKHPEKDTNGYLNYKNSKIVATTKNRGNTFPTVNFKDTHDTVIEILNEIESKRYPVPSGEQDKLLEKSPSHLKKVWDASKIVCEHFKDHEKFSSVNKHLQNFAFNYHPKAPMGPEITNLPSINRPENTNSPRPGCTIC